MRIPILILFCAWGAHGVELLWDANTETNLAGYKVYVGRLSRQYNISTNSTTNTTFTLTNLTGTTFFAVTAFDTDGLESEYSDEVFYTVPGIPPLPPVNLRIRGTNAVAQIRLLQSTALAQNYWRETGIAFVPVTDGIVFYQAAEPKPAKVFISAPASKGGKITAPPKRPVIGPPPMLPMPPK